MEVEVVRYVDGTISSFRTTVEDAEGGGERILVSNVLKYDWVPMWTVGIRVRVDEPLVYL